jgi:hypothetical protein
MTTREPNAKIRLLFVAGLGLYRTQLQSMVSDEMISGTLMRLLTVVALTDPAREFPPLPYGY